MDTAVIYFNLIREGPAGPTDSDRRATLQAKLDYYTKLSKPLSFSDRKEIQKQIDRANSDITQKSEEIKAFTSTALAEAVNPIEVRQAQIRTLRKEVRSSRESLDGTSYDDQIAELEKQIAKIDDDAKVKDRILRAGVLLAGAHRKAALYSIASSGDSSNPYTLKHFQPFPVLTTDEVPFVIIMGQREGQEPKGLHATVTSTAGSYIDGDPVRPVVTQPSAPSLPGNAAMVRKAGCVPLPLAGAYVDRVLTFTDHLAGETVYSVTLTGSGMVTTSDETTVISGSGSPSSEHKVVTSAKNVKVLEADALPQVQSLYRYNISTGVLWSSLRTPSFSRVPTGNYFSTAATRSPALPLACLCTAPIRIPAAPASSRHYCSPSIHSSNVTPRCP